ncbi:hypothetical protein H2200_007524 [Cladophialophora chaetospira]|uniref:Exonuclease domain-containing protein n=1 Tax=Cladophialophora chaetospira TaxID=386627 RepID=A0AA38X8H4_9EURO|nr:hypothetical protein H2200_007524 [Cladophialophora chaetospira]
MSSHQQDTWFTGTIAETPDNLDELLSLCHSTDRLKAHRYDLQPDPHNRIEQKLRCSNCLVRMTRPAESEEVPTDRTRKVCFYHDGRVVACKWTCCNGEVKSLGCVRKHHHVLTPENDRTLQEYWRYYETPPFPVIIQPEPTFNKGKKKKPLKLSLANFNDCRKAVVLDCEMGVSSTKWPELIRFSVVDFFSGENLIDSLVFPDVHLRSLSTPWSGVTWDMMWKAVNAATCFFGRDAAREGLWKFVGPATIVIMHAGENDMNVLRCIHPRIIDTQMLEGGQVGLRNLCARMTGISIQNGAGHDSLEDTLATREIAYIFLKRHLEAKKLAATMTTPIFLPPSVPAKPKSWASLLGSTDSTPGAWAQQEDQWNSEEDQRAEMVDDGFDGEKIDFRGGSQA